MLREHLSRLNSLSVDRRYALSRIILLVLGALLVAIAVVVFYVPSDIAPSGVTGVGVILRELTGVPLGVVLLVANLPIQALGFKMLRGWKTVAETVFAVIVYAALVEIIPQVVPIPQGGITDDTILSALFGGVIGGIGGGLVYRAGGTMGGTSTLARIMRRKWGMPLRNTAIYTDALVLAAAAVVLGWEQALYGTLALFVSRVAAEYMLEDSSHTSTALIVTHSPSLVSEALRSEFEHEVMSWGCDDDQDTDRGIVMLTLARNEVSALRKLLRVLAPDAFVTVLKGQVAFGDGFKSIEPEMPLLLDEIEADRDFNMERIKELAAD